MADVADVSRRSSMNRYLLTRQGSLYNGRVMTVIDLRIPDEQVERLDRLASAMHKTRREATAQLIEEALRHEEFPCVEFRDSIAGRQAYVVGSGLAVWEFVMVAESRHVSSC